MQRRVRYMAGPRARAGSATRGSRARTWRESRGGRCGTPPTRHGPRCLGACPPHEVGDVVALDILPQDDVVATRCRCGRCAGDLDRLGEPRGVGGRVGLLHRDGARGNREGLIETVGANGIRGGDGGAPVPRRRAAWRWGWWSRSRRCRRTRCPGR